MSQYIGSSVAGSDISDIRSVGAESDIINVGHNEVGSIINDIGFKGIRYGCRRRPTRATGRPAFCPLTPLSLRPWLLVPGRRAFIALRPCGNIALAAVAVRICLGFGMEVLRIRRWPPSPASPARRPRGDEDDAIRRASRLRSLGARRLGAARRWVPIPASLARHPRGVEDDAIRHTPRRCSRAPEGQRLDLPSAGRAELGACTRWSARTLPLASITSVTSSGIKGRGRETSATSCDGRGPGERRTTSSGGLGAGARDPLSKATTRDFAFL